MPTVILDIIRNTSSRLSESSNRSVMYRDVVVDELDAANVNLKIKQAENAILAVVGSEGNSHPVNTWLPFSHVEGRLIGTTKYRGRIEYRQTPFGFPNQPAETIAEFRTAFETVNWYSLPTTFDSSGRPNGPIRSVAGKAIVQPTAAEWNGTDPLPKVKTPDPWQRQVPVARIFVPTVLSINPFPIVASRVEHTNQQSVIWGGFAFPPNTLRFDSVSVSWQDLQGSSRFSVLYQFTAKASEFVHEVVSTNTPLTTTFEDAHPRADFLNPPFPVHA